MIRANPRRLVVGPRHLLIDGPTLLSSSITQNIRAGAGRSRARGPAASYRGPRQSGYVLRGTGIRPKSYLVTLMSQQSTFTSRCPRRQPGGRVLGRLPVAAGMGGDPADEPSADHAPRGRARAPGPLRRDGRLLRCAICAAPPATRAAAPWAAPLLGREGRAGGDGAQGAQRPPMGTAVSVSSAVNGRISAWVSARAADACRVRA